jgi:hypothetical protein
MPMKTWNDIRLPRHEERIWELYHENSKTSRFARSGMDPDNVLNPTYDDLHRSLPMQSTWGADLLDKRTSDELSVSDILTAESAPEAHISSFEQLCVRD